MDDLLVGVFSRAGLELPVVINDDSVCLGPSGILWVNRMDELQLIVVLWSSS